MRILRTSFGKEQKQLALLKLIFVGGATETCIRSSDNPKMCLLHAPWWIPASAYRDLDEKPTKSTGGNEVAEIVRTSMWMRTKEIDGIEVDILRRPRREPVDVLTIFKEKQNEYY